MNRFMKMAVLAPAGSLLLAVGCNSTSGNLNSSYETAIDSHFQASPVCLWQQPKKFPVQAATSDDSKTEGYDALTQAGLLMRTTAEKKVFLIASKQVNNYDLSDQGRHTWTPDPSEPGYGNFCYGTRSVSSIDATNAGTNSAGAKTMAVDYHYKIGGVPDWAKAPQMQTAFPAISTALTTNQAAKATLVENSGHWSYGS